MIATDTLSLLFIGCFLLGMLYLVITALFGNLAHGHGGVQHVDHSMTHHALTHHTHVGHGSTHRSSDGDSDNNQFSLLSIINPTNIVLFLIGFGFFGYALHTNTNFALPIILLLSASSGVILALLLLLFFSRVFSGSEAATVQDVSDRTGLLGKVSITIQKDEIGEILYVSPGGMRKSIAARSVDGRRLERDQEVVVVNYQRGIAEVDTWDHFVNQEDSAAVSQPEVDDLATLRELLEEPNKNDSTYVMKNEKE